ncbi:hypothetical protein BDQ12DRAFT_674551 [Crucibulum laeve]|uniref:Uncharacterized protein n=1 Tax=Crucibulum laeve TaxID=68775 RepID=A0A5C3MDB9_9AGAR|nr:hypothetical protein BDQ12DRAFT_674551 [Crucibulum laeve]
MNKGDSICEGVHPGVVKTNLNKDFGEATAQDELFQPEDATANLINLVVNLRRDQRQDIVVTAIRWPLECECPRDESAV